MAYPVRISVERTLKRRARGYRNKDKMITIIYLIYLIDLIAGKLPPPKIHTI